jgi:4-hydroxybenzoate polyprenyltransferase
MEQILTVPLDIKIWPRMLRMHQWLKNLLLFVPIFAGHQFTDLNMLLLLFLAFFSFSLCASSVYIINDLVDLENDRAHPRKSKRPFASGEVPIWMGCVLAPVLLVSSFFLAWKVNANFLSWLISYFVLTCLYSFYLKRLMLVDCLILAILYTGASVV